MASADFVVTKPGPITILEALTSTCPLLLAGTPMIQEAPNIALVRQWGIGRHDAHLTARNIRAFIGNPQALTDCRRAVALHCHLVSSPEVLYRKLLQHAFSPSIRPVARTAAPKFPSRS